MANSRLNLILLLAICVSYTLGHSYVTSPTSRSNQKQSNAGCRGPECLGPCDVPLNKARTPAVTIARGASINVQWPRNNHAGGFIRLAWTQTSGSDVHANFDAGVQEIVCHEVGGCRPDDINNPNGGDSGAGDGSTNPCQTTINVPLHLADGEWTLQWAWFGGAFALGDYYSCVDYKIQGGPTSAKVEAVFKGGDFTYPGQNKCKFFNTDRLHQCTREPCEKPLFSGEQSGPAFGFSGSQPTKPITTATPQPLTTGAKVVTPITTGAKIVAPLTTGKIKTPMTSGSGRVTTSAPAPMTTGKIQSQPETVKNCAKLSKQVSSTQFEITAVDTWADNFRMEVRMDMHEDVSDWMVQVIWPEDAFDTEIEHVYNSGSLQCSATVPSRHSMIAPVAKWANDAKSGEQMYIEIRAKNTNMNSEFLKSNTKFIMFKK